MSKKIIIGETTKKHMWGKTKTLVWSEKQEGIVQGKNLLDDRDSDKNTGWDRTQLYREEFRGNYPACRGSLVWEGAEKEEEKICSLLASNHPSRLPLWNIYKIRLNPVRRTGIRREEYLRFLVGGRVTAFVQRVIKHVRFGQVFLKLALDVTIVHVSGHRFAGNTDQEMSHLGRDVAKRKDSEHVRFVQKTQFFDVRMHGNEFIGDCPVDVKTQNK